MNKNKLLIILACFLFATGNAQSKSTEVRKFWISYMDKIARPVLSSLAEDRLKEKMPVVLSPKVDDRENRLKASYLEAFGRTLSGIAPWLNIEGGSKEEVRLRDQYRQWTLKAIANAVNLQAKDYLTWSGGQPLVDASFFSLGLIRCPWLWEHLSDTTKQQVVAALKTTRNTVPVYTNWILFTGMIEAFFCKYGYEYDKVRIEYGIREFAQHWYVGDGWFSDGMSFAFDYYNSYVIQPYLANIINAVNSKGKAYEWLSPQLDKINKRYAEIQERMINADGSFPVIGRSITYRGGAFHHLSDMVLRKQLPASLHAAQVRSALTAVIKKTMESPLTFTKNGWLNIGLYGSQADLADFYINTGSEYLCMNIFLPLGLPDTDEFWSAPSEPWTSVKVWSGEDIQGDHALHVK